MPDLAIVKQLDPRNLSDEDKKLLHRFLLSEENKKKGDKKFKFFQIF